MLNHGWSPFGWMSPTKRAGALPSLVVYLDGDDTDGSANSTRTNGVAFNDWLNKGSLGGTFSQVAPASRPLFVTGLLNGHAGATFDATDHLISSLAAASFTFMHDGNGSTIYSVVRTATSGVRTIAATSTGSPANRGIGHRINTGFAASFFMSDGISSLQIAVNGAASSVSTNLFDIMSSTLASASTPDLNIVTNGTSVATANATGFSALAPASTLVVGATPAPAFPLTGDLVCLLVYNVAHDATQRAEVEAFLAAKYGVVFPA